MVNKHILKVSCYKTSISSISYTLAITSVTVISCSCRLCAVLLLCGVYVLVEQYGSAVSSCFTVCGLWFNVLKCSAECGSGCISY
jgi:hypothetical protein